MKEVEIMKEKKYDSFHYNIISSQELFDVSLTPSLLKSLKGKADYFSLK